MKHDAPIKMTKFEKWFLILAFAFFAIRVIIETKPFEWIVK